MSFSIFTSLFFHFFPPPSVNHNLSFLLIFTSHLSSFRLWDVSKETLKLFRLTNKPSDSEPCSVGNNSLNTEAETKLAFIIILIMRRGSSCTVLHFISWVTFQVLLMTYLLFYRDYADVDSTGCCIMAFCPSFNTFLPLWIMSFQPERLFIPIHSSFLWRFSWAQRGAPLSSSLAYWVMFGSRLANK